MIHTQCRCTAIQAYLKKLTFKLLYVFYCASASSVGLRLLMYVCVVRGTSTRYIYFFKITGVQQ